MFAVVTFLGLLKVAGLIGALMLVMGFFFWAIESGGIFGWWMATDYLPNGRKDVTCNVDHVVGMMRD